MRKVADIMTADPVTTSPDTPLLDALRLMKHHNCRQLPVLAEGRLVGILTDRDVRLAMQSPFVLHERSDDDTLLRNVVAGDCMTASPLTVEADAPAVTAADLMRTYKFGALPVMHNGGMVGIVTISDILRSYVELFSSESGEKK
jgi:acetoin utilization protein AcuB